MGSKEKEIRLLGHVEKKENGRGMSGRRRHGHMSSRRGSGDQREE
jgi:hypothetical protein